ncbi:MAG: molybdopterin molybdenumtransferase MoeA, partial [Thermoanaerobacteraceae bacterium]|nr:molybdopterin molybdenumtransferase MoeA [Thermoanaerobacteraceae bacterium]
MAEAKQRLREALKPFPAEEAALPEALGRVLAAEVRAAEDVPGFDRATMD